MAKPLFETFFGVQAVSQTRLPAFLLTERVTGLGTAGQDAAHVRGERHARPGAAGAARDRRGHRGRARDARAHGVRRGPGAPAGCLGCGSGVSDVSTVFSMVISKLLGCVLTRRCVEMFRMFCRSLLAKLLR